MDLQNILNSILEIVEENCNEGNYIKISNLLKEVYKNENNSEELQQLQERNQELEIELSELEDDKTYLHINLFLAGIITPNNNYFSIYQCHTDEGIINDIDICCDSTFEEWIKLIIPEFSNWYIYTYFPFCIPELSVSISQLLEAKQYSRENDKDYIMWETDESVSKQVLTILLIKELNNKTNEMSEEIIEKMREHYDFIIRESFESLCPECFIGESCSPYYSCCDYCNLPDLV